MKRLDYAVAAAMLLLAALVLYGTRGLPVWDEYAPGSRLMPVLVAGASVLLALMLVVATWRQVDDQAVDWPDRGGAARVIATMAGLAAIIVLTPWLGLIPAAALFVLFQLVAILRHRLVPSVLTTLVVGLLLHSVFTLWLDLRLPKGVVGF